MDPHGLVSQQFSKVAKSARSSHQPLMGSYIQSVKRVPAGRVPLHCDNWSMPTRQLRPTREKPPNHGIIDSKIQRFHCHHLSQSAVKIKPVCPCLLPVCVHQQICECAPMVVIPYYINAAIKATLGGYQQNTSKENWTMFRGQYKWPAGRKASSPLRPLSPPLATTATTATASIRQAPEPRRAEAPSLLRSARLATMAEVTELPGFVVPPALEAWTSSCEEGKIGASAPRVFHSAPSGFPGGKKGAWHFCWARNAQARSNAQVRGACRP